MRLKGEIVALSTISCYFNPEWYRFVTNWEFEKVEGDNPCLHRRL